MRMLVTLFSLLAVFSRSLSFRMSHIINPRISSFLRCSNDIADVEQHPVDRFMNFFSLSLKENDLLKIVLSEYSSLNEEEVAPDTSFEIPADVEEISGRLIKSKKISRFQLQLRYKNKQSTTSNLLSDEACQHIRHYLDGGFRKAVLNTATAEYEFKRRKGKGKFKITLKGFDHIDAEAVIARSLSGVRDSTTIRSIAEERRLLLLSDPSNQEYKVLYAEAKRALEGLNQN